MAINIGTTGSAGRFVGGEHIYRNANNLKLYLDPYKFESFTGESTSTIYDLSGEDNNLTLVNGATDRENGHWDFDGTDDFAYITDASMTDLDIGTNDFTIQWWMYMDGNTTTYFFMKGSVTANGYNVYHYTGNIRLRVSGSLVINDGSSAWYGQWVNVAMCVDRGTSASLYRNGVLVADDYATPGSTSENVSQSFIMGGYSTSTSPSTVSNEHNGKLGPVLFYKGEALSADAVRHNFNVHRGLYGV
jgi:hypothetical protein